MDDLDAPGVADRSEYQLLARSRATTVTVTPWARFMMIGAAASVQWLLASGSVAMATAGPVITALLADLTDSRA